MPPETGLQQATTVTPAAEAQTPGSPATPAVPRLGQRVGGYELWERLGSGGMGDVYRAFHAETGEEVALKLLRGEERPSPAVLRSMRREVEAARRLDHPGILPILAAGEHEGVPFYVMPLAAGGSLADRLRAGIEPRAGVAILARAARAVHAAHLKGVIHRDLKPGNILLGAGGAPLVADFGLARFSDQASAHTATGDLMGSPYYMAPEQAAGRSHKATPATDVWPVGVILYELLTGVRPFRGDTLEVLRRIEADEPLAPRHVRGGVPPDLEAVCLRCLRKTPRERYRSMTDLADDLEAWLSGTPIKSHAPPETRAWVRGINGSTARCLLLLAGCLAGVALLAPARAPSPTPEEMLLRAEARSGPGRPLVLVDRGKPRFPFRIIHGEEYSIVTLPAGKPLAIQTSRAGICLVEFLPPSAGRKPFRLTAVLAHINSDSKGPMPVGVYVGRTDWPAAEGGKNHLLLAAEYIDPAMLRLAGRDPDSMENGGHFAELTRWYVGATTRPIHRGWSDRPDAMVWLPRKPAPAGEAVPTQTLTVEVRAGRFCLIHGSPPRQEECVPVATAQSRTIRGLQRKLKLTPPGPLFPPGGGIGVFIHNGSVRLHRLEFEPLE